MDYRMVHQPFEDGDELWALSGRGTFPPDVYDHPEWYSYGDAAKECAAIIKAVRGCPDAPVTIYRAVPHGISTINTGDWVFIAESPARLHAQVSEDPAADWPVITATVRADQIRSGGSDIIEWGYYGPTLTATTVNTVA